MTTALAKTVAGGTDSVLPPRRRLSRAKRSETAGALLLLQPFLLLLLLAGLIPATYAIWTSFLDRKGAFAGISNYLNVVADFRFIATFINVLVTMVIFVPLIVISAVGFALLIHASSRRLSGTVRFIFYLPGAFAGIANFVLWLFILDPTVSPVRWFWAALGYDTLGQVAQGSNVPAILSLILLFQGVGSWMLIVYGALNTIPDEIIEAADLDGANFFQKAWRITIPIMKPWIAYLAIMNIAYVLQLFLEPSLLGKATNGKISPEWTPNQLSFTFAYGVGDLGAAAAMSVILLVLTLGIGLFIITRTELFGERES